MPKTVGELAEEIGVTHITIKNVVRELEANGLAKVTGHPTDKRAKHIRLTNKGAKLLQQLKPVWTNFSRALKQIMTSGHPDLLNILNRVERKINNTPIHDDSYQNSETGVQVLDYKPSLKKYFYELAGHWLLGVLKGTLEEEDKYTLNNPDKAYLENGGFVFFALVKDQVVGCVALKRLNEDTFEFAKLFIDPEARNLGIATKLIERCISRCKENNAKQLWLQTTMAMRDAHNLYYKLGFEDRPAPKQMDVLKRTEKIMVMGL
jgi:DNA-binding MarR family transcriptional regulator/N-acetylglutamate synthase-like GNAT family acetyltransferase